jgi:hypothetical protein
MARGLWRGAMIRNACFIAGLVISTTLCAGQGRGSVSVKVLGEHGVPVEGAMVRANPITRCAMAMAIPECLTESAGSCTLNLYYDQKCGGKYSITASKVEDGYPELDSWFYSAADPTFKETDVELSDDHLSDAVSIHLGKRAGILTGTVEDAATGQPLFAGVRFSWVSIPRNFLGTGLNKPKFRILIPSDTPIIMIVLQKGYEDWTYALGKGAMKNAIVLRPGEEMKLDIRLLTKK